MNARSSAYKRFRIPMNASVFLLLAGGLIACQGAAPIATSTSTPLPAPTSTSTPSPTATRVPSPTPDAAATAAAEETAIAVFLDLTVRRELAEVDRQNLEGEVAFFVPEPYELVVDGFNSYVYAPMDPGRIYSNFILHYEVTWDSETGVAGCGVIFRSEEDFEQGEQYRFNAIRLSGFPGWDVELWNFGDWVSTTTGDVRQSTAILLGSGSTNEYFLEADESTFTGYANGDKLGSTTVHKRAEGEIAFFAWQDSGRTSCTYENVWVFVLPN